MVYKIRPAMMVHLGDYDKDAFRLQKIFPDIPLHMVRGNGDIFSQTPKLKELTVEDKKIVLTHGHLYDVKSSLTALLSMGLAAGAHMLLYGHTHIPHDAFIHQMHVVNPGSAQELCAHIQIKDRESKCSHLPL